MHSVPTREEFLYISDNGKHLFYTITYLCVAIMGYQFWLKSHFWMKGKPMPGGDGKWRIPTIAQGKKWAFQFLRYVMAQEKIRGSRKKSGSPIHLLIFYGFFTFFMATTLLAVNTYSPIKFHYGVYFEIYSVTVDLMGVAFIVGVVWAIGRRFLYNHRKNGIMGHKWSDYWTLCLLLILALTGFWLAAARVSATPWHDWYWVTPTATAWGLAEGRYSPAMYQFVWWFHMGWIWLFFLTIPLMKLKHIVVAIPVVACEPGTPMGRLEPISMEEVEKTGKIGALEAADFDRWHLMSLDACTECGRCTEVCPAWNVGKILDPQQIVQKSRRAMYDQVPLGTTITEEELWDCTTCNACVEVCPVLIRQVDLIVDMRRGLVAEGKLAGSAAGMLRQTGSTGSAWGSSTDREGWMQNLNIPLAKEKKEFEYLFWVGCAGATDPSAIRTTQAFAQLMQKAGVDFACLGNEESCTGDPARRVGDEFLFQEKAMGNIETLKRYKFSKIVTCCPHCLNTVRNEYPDFEGQFEVEHHTQLLARLIEEGKLKPAQGEVTYHDPCYLARVNKESDAPRSLMALPVKEPEHNRHKTLCCGAGGGRMFMEEEAGKRPSERRVNELLETGASTVALGCPFCKIMLETGVPADKTDSIRLVDLAVLVQESNSAQN